MLGSRTVEVQYGQQQLDYNHYQGQGPTTYSYIQVQPLYDPNKVILDRLDKLELALREIRSLLTPKENQQNGRQ